MNKIHRMINLLIIILIILNFVEPFKDNYFGEYFYSDNTLIYDELFYKQNCLQDGFYWIGNFSKYEAMYDDLGEDYIAVTEEENNIFMNILEEGKYKSLPEFKSYLITLFSGKHNSLISFTGTVGAFYDDKEYFNKETLDYALNVDTAIRDGTFVKCLGYVYLIASVGVDNMSGIRYDYELPGEVVKVGVFKLDKKSSEKLISCFDDYRKRDSILFGNSFTFKWMLKMIIGIVFYFLTKPSKRKS